MELDLDLTKRYSFADYLTWFDGRRRELWDGFIKMMTPAPSSYHQATSSTIQGEIYSFLKKKNKNRKCKIFDAPFDVRFPKNNEKDDKKIYTVVQPDIVIICDRNKIDKRGCIGAPDFIAEIISPSTAKNDRDYKYKLYEREGVKEYWIVSPHEKIVQSYILKDKKYIENGIFAKDEKIPVHIFNNELEIEINDIFEDFLEE